MLFLSFKMGRHTVLELHSFYLPISRSVNHPINQSV